MATDHHQTVLVAEAMEALAIKPDGFYIDATFGRGGHSHGILAALNDKGRLLAMDRDPQAVAYGKQQFADDPRFEIVHAAFSQLQQCLCERHLEGTVDGVLLDLGVSSPQLDEAARGFSFLKSGPLDMRMDTTCGQSAAEWINRAREAEIAAVLKDYGEERFAKRIASAIVSRRKEAPFTTTADLAAVIKAANPAWERHKHPATRSFQAIRIFINNELEEIKQVLQQSLQVLAGGGRLVVIAFHSLEDRIVKQFIRQQSLGNLPAGLPVTEDQLSIQMKRVGRAIKPRMEEIALNPRARSAIMRIGEKTA